MKVVYIAHPISGDIKANINRILTIVREINIEQPDIIPFAHYIVDCQALDDDIPAERERGIKNDTELFKRKFIDELWLYGQKISKGMWVEIRLCNELGIPVRAKTSSTELDLLAPQI